MSSASTPVGNSSPHSHGRSRRSHHHKSSSLSPRQHHHIHPSPSPTSTSSDARAWSPSTSPPPSASASASSPSPSPSSSRVRSGSRSRSRARWTSAAVSTAKDAAGGERAVNSDGRDSSSSPSPRGSRSRLALDMLARGENDVRALGRSPPSSSPLEEARLRDLLPPDILKQAMRSKGNKLQVDRSKVMHYIDVSSFAKTVKRLVWQKIVSV
jgi:hypothetical protein